MSDKTEKIELDGLTEAQELAITVVMEEGALRNQESSIKFLQKELDAVIDLRSDEPGYVDGFEHAVLFLKDLWGMSIE